jgi:hypothetical protein
MDWTANLDRGGLSLVLIRLLFGKLLPGGRESEALADSDRRHVAWNWLPVHLAVDVWREYLRKFTLDELFRISPDTIRSGDARGIRMTAFDIIIRKVNERMTMPEVEELDEHGVSLRRKKRSMEFDILKDRVCGYMEPKFTA